MTRFAIFLLFLSVGGWAEELYNLTVSTSNLKNNKGIVQFSLYNKDGTIPDKTQSHYYKKLRVSIKNHKAIVTFENLPKGRYAISLYHDENNNNQIDKGFLLPKEGVGLSNYDKINFLNLPNFKSASFLLDSNKHIDIKTEYF